MFNSVVPAVSGDFSDSVSTEPIAASETQAAKVGEGGSDELEIGVGDGHAFETKLLEVGVVVGHGLDPGLYGGTPVGRDHAEVGEARTAFHLQASELGEAFDEDGG